MGRIIFLILSMGILSCTNNAPTAKADKNGHEQHDTTKESTPLKLNNGAKWKADEATRKNVAALLRTINDSSKFKNGDAMAQGVQIGIDSLVQQCRMKGPEHDALHVWLEEVMQDVKVLKEDGTEYQEAYVELKKDVESFYAFFE